MVKKPELHQFYICMGCRQTHSRLQYSKNKEGKIVPVEDLKCCDNQKLIPLRDYLKKRE